jgi:hypothetical protein
MDETSPAPMVAVNKGKALSIAHCHPFSMILQSDLSLLLLRGKENGAKPPCAKWVGVFNRPFNPLSMFTC